MLTNFEFPNGDTLSIRDRSLIVSFRGPRKVLSTSPLNGGSREDLEWLFNHGAERTQADVRGDTYLDHLTVLTAELGLPSCRTSGLSTAAYVENTSLQTRTYENVSVTAAVTAGIDVNGGRAGDPSSLHESEGRYLYLPGTINILLFINANLTDGAMARALVTCTEAKTAAVQELMAASRYSQGLATGSGTDGIIITADLQAQETLTDAGLHFKLGELIGQCVISAVKEALFLETGLCPARQFDIFRRLDRFGICLESFTERLTNDTRLPAQQIQPLIIRKKLELFAGRSDRVMQSILFAHLLDQLAWGLISQQAARKYALKLFGSTLSPVNDVLDNQLRAGEIDLSIYLLESLVNCFFIDMENLAGR